MRYLILLVGLLLSAFAASPSSAQSTQPASAEPQPYWCTPVPGGTNCYPTAAQACQRQMQAYSGSGFLPLIDVNYKKYKCNWSRGRILPGWITLNCPSGSTLVAPGICIRTAPDRPKERACDSPCQPQSAPRSPTVGNPIALDSGTKVQDEVDYSSADGLLTVERHYRSRMRGSAMYSFKEPSGFGKNWLGLIPGRLSIAGSDASQFEYLPATGGFHSFQSANAADAQNYIFNNVSGSRLRISLFMVPGTTRADYFLTQAAVPGGAAEVRLDYPNGDRVLFRRAGTYNATFFTRLLVPVEHVSASGYARYFDYNGSAEQPYRIRDNLGRQLNLSWAVTNSTDYRPGNSDAVVSSVGLPDGSSLAYEYDNANNWVNPANTSQIVKDRLKSVKRKDSAANILWGRNYVYENSADPFALTGITDQAGNRLSTYGYDSALLANSTELAGGVNKYIVAHTKPLTGSGTVYRTVTNPLGRVSKYDFQVPPTSSQYVPGQLRRIDGEAANNVPADTQLFSYASALTISNTDARGNVTAITNDVANGRPTSVTEATGTAQARTTAITWHPTLDLPTREERTGLRSDYVYDAQGRLISRTETDTTTQTVPYATGGQTRTTSFDWTNEGRIASVNGPLGVNAQGQDDITSFVYDTSGNLVSMTNALGHVVSFAGHDANGRPATATDANGAITAFSYDLLGRIKTINAKHPVDVGLDAVTTMDYDNEGRVTALAAPLTAKLSMAYDLAGRLLSVSAPDGENIAFVYDLMGNVLSQTVNRADGSDASMVTRTFDALGRMLTETLGLGRTSSFAYDKNDNPVSITSARGHVTAASFDALDRLVTAVAPGSASSTTAYNQLDDATGFTDPLSVTSLFVRNGFGDVIRETSPDRGTSDYYYDAAGMRSAAIDGRGVRVDYARDVLGRVIAKTPVASPAQAITYAYDAGSFGKGRLSSVIDPSGVTAFTYDHKGNMLTKLQSIGMAVAILGYSYDLADRIVQIAYPSGRIVDYVRDGKGRVASVTSRATAGAAPVSLLASAAYESFGALKAATYGNGTALTQDWGNDGRLAGKHLARTADSSNLSLLSYAYDADDNMTAISDAVTPANSVAYAYDNRDRLVRADNAQGQYARQDFVYDANGNRMAVEWRTAANDTVPAKADSYARTAGTNRLASLTGDGSTRQFVHDAHGNLAAETRTDALGGSVSVTTAYDSYGRLTGYTQASLPALTMAYNGLDDRVSLTESVGGTPTGIKHYVYDSMGRMLGEYGTSANDSRAEYIYLTPDAANDNPSPYGGDDGTGGYSLLAIIASGGVGNPETLWVHSSHLGVPVLTVDASGNETPPGVYAQIMFPGQVKTLPDLYYNRYRDYDPTTGRYIQADPIGLAGGANPYLYAEGNPVRFIDPTGEIVWVPLIIGAAVFFGEGYLIDVGIQYFWEGKSWHCINQRRAIGSGVMGIATGGGVYTAFRYGAPIVRPFINRIPKIRWSGKGAGGGDITGVGPFAGKSIPARSPSQRFSSAERAQVDEIGYKFGCHTCGAPNPGTKSGHFVPDHQPASALNPTNGPQSLYPHCLNCSNAQGLEIIQRIRQGTKK